MGVLELRDITESDILSLASADDVVRFFAKLGYNTNVRTKQTPANINITGDEISRQISSVELVADQEGLLQVYLFELRSVTVAATQTIARALRNLPVNILMVLTTSDYERIDFVLLEKVAPKEGKKWPMAKQVGVVPRVLSVKRHSPDRKEMRLLRRMHYTEQDPWAQYAKLVSAFSMIGWTEEFYINRALFSDYVLNNRLRSTPDWKDNPSIVFREFTKICYKAGTYHSEKKDSEFFMNKFVEPVLDALGFHLKQNGAPHDKEEKMVEEPDYHLYVSEKKDKAVGGLCAYPWDRSLDNIDDVRDPERGARIPGQYVVRLLEKGDLPWIVVTNGKFWRLYTQKTHSKATEFYEVDLEEILAMEDPQEAFRYFWLLFRAEAFRPKPHSIEGETKEVCLLDYLLLESETYARELGEKLKDNIFKNIFPKLAKGFIVRMGGPGKYLTMSEKDRDKELSQVFRGTLTFLYRVLFLNYAESRDLLPVREVRGYWEVSLQKMKDEIAKKSGEIRDKVAENIRKGYAASGTTLYDRLTELFEIVDKGAPRLNMPTYNGGLFFTDPSATDESMEATNARFLKLNKIPDRFLAEGIDLMARELDEKTTRLEFIDYKSLGVRQLGSIYEGLLEFNIRVAPEDMAVVKGKKAEKVVPLAEAKKPKDVIKKGEVYLENDRHERKTTGSYYTPDYIVKYIVENTVGPVLAERLEKLRPKLRSHSPEPSLVDELFEVRVLDPAMGSGHFLVEAVDFITDRLVNYLSRFPNNPVQMEIERTRQEILSEMDKRGIVVDPARLTDLNILRRHVLKRCIYGVDLNPMAVELAKVSLWLHCFTLGAPLSFLDHHLKCGNSLIGAKVDEVAEAVESGQMTLLSTSRFGGVNKATDMMLRIGELSDVTPDQVMKSRENYKTALTMIEPYKRMLDVYTSRWFGNDVQTVGRGKTRKTVDMALAFLKSGSSETWLRNLEVSSGLRPEYGEVVEIAMNAAQNRVWRFFHWELEFPEVWFVKGKRKENPGFDAVVGNPPYGYRTFGDFSTYLREQMHVGKSENIAEYFIQKSIEITSKYGLYGMILPKQLTYVPTWSKIRSRIVGRFDLKLIIDATEAFEGVLLEQAIIVAIPKEASIRSITTGVVDKGIRELGTISPTKISSRIWPIYSFSNYDQLLTKVNICSRELGDICNVYHGLKNIRPHMNYQCGEIILRGDNIGRYTCNEDLLKLPTKHITEAERDRHCQKKIVVQQIVAHVTKPYPHIILMGNMDYTKSIIFETLNTVVSHNVKYSQEFLLAIINSKWNSWFVHRFIFNLSVRTMMYRLGYLDFTPIRIILFNTPEKERAVLIEDLKNLLLKDASLDIVKRVEEMLPKDAKGRFLAFKDGPGWKYNPEKREGKGTCPEKSDVVHDFLAFLAERMIELNKGKQTEQKRFLNWLETQLQIRPKDDTIGMEALTGKTKIKGYLGDYQKGEGELPFNDLMGVFLNNRSRIGANLSDPRFANHIKTNYEKSLTVLRPIREKLTKTDWLIDQVVYCLYSLTNEEIAVVEGGEKE